MFADAAKGANVAGAVGAAASWRDKETVALSNGTPVTFDRPNRFNTELGMPFINRIFPFMIVMKTKIEQSLNCEV